MVYLGGIRNELRPALVDTDLDKDPSEIGNKNEEGVYTPPHFKNENGIYIPVNPDPYTDEDESGIIVIKDDEYGDEIHVDLETGEITDYLVDEETGQ
jgi:hypothetical protein